MTDVSSIALRGLQLQQQQLQKSANNIANISERKTDLAQESVNLLQTKTAFKANIAVLKTEKEMTDSLLDVLA